MYGILHFSATGNTKFLADGLRQELGVGEEKLFNIENVSIEQLEGVSRLIILSCIHAFSVPSIVLKKLKKLKLSSQVIEEVHFVSVGCNTSWVNSAATRPLIKYFSKLGICIGVNEVLAMPLTLVMKFPLDSGREIIFDSINQISEIAKKIHNQNGYYQQKPPLKARIFRKLASVERVASKFFGLELHATKNCIKCGKCYNSLCPKGNISAKKNGKPKIGLKCMMCMRCVYSCPKNAFRPYIARFLPIKGGYKLEEYLNHNGDQKKLEEK